MMISQEAGEYEEKKNHQSCGLRSDKPSGPDYAVSADLAGICILKTVQGGAVQFKASSKRDSSGQFFSRLEAGKTLYL